MGQTVLDGDKIATVGEPAWHSLGKNYKEPISAEEAHDDMGGSFHLSHHPVGVMFDDEFVEIPTQFAIVRSGTNRNSKPIIFGFSTDHYHIIQPIDIIKKFDEKVKVSISSMGFIQDGRKMFLCWELPSYEVVKDDWMKLYGSVLFGFDKIFSSRLNIATTRIVCDNTWTANLAEAQSEKGKNRGRGTIYAGKHSNKKLLYELGEWMQHIQQNAEQQVDLTKSFFKKLVDTKIHHEQQAKDLIYAGWSDPNPVPDFFPETLRKQEQEKIDKQAEKAEAIRNGIYNLFSTNEGISIDQTNCYGLFNACTQYFNHEQKSKKDTSYSIVWGNRNLEMNKFAEVLRNVGD